MHVLSGVKGQTAFFIPFLLIIATHTHTFANAFANAGPRAYGSGPHLS